LSSQIDKPNYTILNLILMGAFDIFKHNPERIVKIMSILMPFYYNLLLSIMPC